MRPRPVLLLVSLGLAAALGLASGARADVVHLKDGAILEGRIVAETATHVRIQTRFGTADVERSRIDRIEKKRTPQDEYQERRNALAPDDVNARFELAMFCKENKLTKEYRALLEEVIALHPQHDGANRELGRIQYEGRWFTKEGLEQFKEEEKRRMEESGMVFHAGRWMTEEEAMTAKGYVLVDGQWLERAVADRLKAARDFEQVFGVPLTISDSEHFSVRNTRTDEDNQYLLDVCEAAYAHFIELTQPDEKETEFLTYYKFHVYVLDTPDDCNKFIVSGYIDRYTPPKNTKERYLDCTNFSYFFPQPLIVLSEGRHLKAGGDRETALIGMAMIHLGQSFIRRLKRGGGLPSWAEAGIAHYFEGEFNGYATVSVVEYPHYEPHVDKWIEGWENFPRWQEKLADPKVVASLPTIRQMNDLPVEELRVDALAKSWSLVRFLLEHHRAEFLQFVRNAKVNFRGDQISVPDAYRAAFGSLTEEALEREWTEWLRTGGKVDARAPGAPGVLR